jgi:hypothetical protein
VVDGTTGVIAHNTVPIRPITLQSYDKQKNMQSGDNQHINLMKMLLLVSRLEGYKQSQTRKAKQEQTNEAKQAKAA